MALSLTSNPYEICFSKNAVKFVFANTYHKMLLEIYVQDADTPANYNLITTLDSLSATPSFDIWEYLDNELEYEYPAKSSNAILTSYKCARMYKLVAKAYDDSNTLQQTLQVNNGGDNFKVIKGGLGYELKDTAFFASYISTHKGFLTWNKEVLIFPDQKCYLPYLKPTSDESKLHLRVYFTDGTQESFSTPALSGDKWTLYQIPIGWEDLVDFYTIATAKTPYQYEISVRHMNTGAYQSEVFTVGLNLLPYRTAKTFMYYNSLCGLQVLFVAGMIKEEFSVSITKGAAISEDNYLLETNDYPLSRKAFDVASGFISKDRYLSLRDFLHCAAPIEQKEKNISITIAKRSIKIDEEETLYNFAFKYKYNYEDRVVSPAELRTLDQQFALQIDNDDHYILIDNHHRLILE